MNVRSDRLGSVVIASLALSTAMLTGCGGNSPTVQNSVTPTVEPSAITSSPSLSPNATSPNSGKGKKRQAAVPCAVDEPIKGRVTAKGRKIYVEPGAPNYAKFRTTQCFKTVAEAQAAGYQARKPAAPQQLDDSNS